MLTRYSGAAFMAAILLFGILPADATADTTGNTGRAAIAVRQASFQDIEGKISQIDQEKIIIDGVSFSYEWKVNPDFAPIALTSFSPGDQILFQVNNHGRIIKIAPKSPAAPAVPPRQATDTSPTHSTPIKQQNGVWTN